MSFHEIGAFDAKAKLSELLRSVSHGKCYRITLRGKPVADLIPSEAAIQQEVQHAITEMRAFRKVTGIPGREISDMIAQGRR